MTPLGMISRSLRLSSPPPPGAGMKSASPQSKYIRNGAMRLSTTALGLPVALSVIWRARTNCGACGGTKEQRELNSCACRRWQQGDGGDGEAGWG